MDPNNFPNFQGNEQNFNFDPNFYSHPNFQMLMQMMRQNPSNFIQSGSSSNPLPNFPQPNLSEYGHDSGSYQRPQQIPYSEANFSQYPSSQPNYMTSPIAQISSNQGVSREGDDVGEDDVVETFPPNVVIEPLLPPPVRRRSKSKSTGAPKQSGSSGNNMIWSIREEEAVISCYMEHCTDGIIGTNQSGAELWRKIGASYEAARESRPHELPPRNVNSIRARWSRMGKDVMKWVGYLEEAERMTRSGEVDADVKRQAHILWRRAENCNFIFENAYDLLSKYNKWKPRLERYLPRKKVVVDNTQASDPDSGSSGKRVRLEEDGEDDGSSLPTDDSDGHTFMSGGVARARGVKKQKEKRYRGSSRSSSNEAAMTLGEKLQLHAELRGVDINLQKERLAFDRERERRMEEQMKLEREHMEMQKEHMRTQNLKTKYDLLERLLQKSSLTPEEEAFKNKLMRDIYEG